MFAAPNTFFTAVGKLTTVTFPSGTSTWTSPANVSLLVSAVGKGADGFAGGWAGTPIQFAVLGVTNNTPFCTQPYSTSPTYQYVYDQGAAVYNGTTGVRTINYWQRQVWYNTNTAGGNWGGPNQFLYLSLQIQGTCYNVVQSEYAARSSKIADYTGGGGSASYLVYAPDYYIDPYIGANTTGFSLTFSGGAYVPATTTTYTNVSITPSTTYTIVNNGSLTIQYYA